MKNSSIAFFVVLLSFSVLGYAASTVSSAQSASASAKVPVQQEMVNINTADVQTLTRLKGVGEKKAAAIIAWRKANGNFKTLEEFTYVHGIGPAVLEANRKMIRVE